LRVAIGIAVLGACGEEPYRLEIRVTDAIAAAAQDGDGPWEPLALDADGAASFDVHSGRYGVAYLCGSDAPVRARFTTVGYSIEQAPYWRACPGEPALATVSGTTAPGATVFVGTSGVDADAAGAYSVALIPGSYDVIAYLPGSPARVQIVRMVDVTADTTLDVPVATDGIAMDTQPPTVTGATSLDRVYSVLFTERATVATFSSPPPLAPSLPAGLALPGERLAIGAWSGGCRTQASLDGAAPAMVMQHATIGVDRATMHVTADATDDWESVTTRLRVETATTSTLVGYAASRDWMLDAGTPDALPLADAASLPGWDTAMAGFDPGQVVTWIASIRSGDFFAGDSHYCFAEGSLAW
jgi:hypothetical protein